MGSSHQEWITWGVAGVGPSGVRGSEGGVTGVLVARLTIAGGRLRVRGSSVPGFIKDLEDSQDEAAALLVEIKVAAQLDRLLF